MQTNHNDFMKRFNDILYEDSKDSPTGVTLARLTLFTWHALERMKEIEKEIEKEDA